MAASTVHLPCMTTGANSMDESVMKAIVALLPYGGCATPDVATSGQPGATAWSDLARSGFKAVVDLREPSEPRGHDEAAEIARAGLTYLPLPVSHETLVDRQFDVLRDFLRDSRNRPALIHCQSANRVGALLLPYLVLDQHLPIDEAQQRAAAIGLRSPDYAALALDYVKRHAQTEG
ncbi:MAG: sulfur transferase domain-containing protein [Gemmatimonadaceae bacterium]